MNKEAYEELRKLYEKRKESIESQLTEFKEIHETGNERRIFEELTFCILTSAVGPKVGQRSLDAIKDILLEGSEQEIYQGLDGVHKYPGKADFIVHTRDYLEDEFDFKLRELIFSFDDSVERRDFFAANKGIKGLGYVQASHFLRNIGFGDYAILDKNILKTLYEFGLIENTKPASSKKRYLEVEQKMKELAEDLGIGLDGLDLLLWSRRTGLIPK